MSQHPNSNPVPSNRNSIAISRLAAILRDKFVSPRELLELADELHHGCGFDPDEFDRRASIQPKSSLDGSKAWHAYDARFLEILGRTVDGNYMGDMKLKDAVAAVNHSMVVGVVQAFRSLVKLMTLQGVHSNIPVDGAFVTILGAAMKSLRLPPLDDLGDVGDRELGSFTPDEFAHYLTDMPGFIRRVKDRLAK